MSKIKIQSFQLKPMVDSLQNLYEKDLSISLSYKISKIKKTFVSHFEDFEEQRNKLIQKHAKKDKKGNPVAPKDEQGNELQDQVQIEDLDAFYKDLSELGTEEIEVDLPVEVALDDLEKEELKLKPNIIEGLLPVLDAKAN